MLRAREFEARRLAQVAARTTNAVIITDRGGRIEWVNDSFTRVTGYSLDEVIGRKPGPVLQGPATSNEAIEYMRAELAAGRGFQTEVINYTKSGVPLYLTIHCQPLIDNGHISGFIAVETDTTERVRLETGLRESEK